jgi:putative spermidine/putrescine transport system ATP-binding protein
VRGTVQEVQYFGAFTRLRVGGEGTLLQVDLPASAAEPPRPGQDVHLHWDSAAVHALAD